MSSNSYDIPRFGGSGSSFFGAELGDSWLFIGSIVAGLIAGHFNVLLYAVVPAAGYMLNREYVHWLASGPPGRLRCWLYELGLVGYPAGHVSPKVVIVGDARGVCPASTDLLDAVEQRLRRRAAGVAEGGSTEGGDGVAAQRPATVRAPVDAGIDAEVDDVIAEYFSSTVRRGKRDGMREGNRDADSSRSGGRHGA